MTNAKNKQPGAQTPFLQTHSPVRPYGAHELEQIFEDMKSEMKKPDKGGFYHAATTIGTHAPKLASSRNKTTAVLLQAGQGNRPGRLAASGNGRYAPYMKALLRPIIILNQPGQDSLFERLMAGDQGLLPAFEAVFGLEARVDLIQGMKARAAGPKVSITRENYPVFFLPGEDGKDLQASPAGSIEAHANMKSLMISMRARAKKDREAGQAATYGDWSVLSFADKAQNVIVGAPIDRTRFRASFPGTLNEIEAEVWRYRKSGRFPRMRDRDAAATLVEFALERARFEDRDTYRGGDVKERLVDNRAKFLVLRAKHFITDIHQALLAHGFAPNDLPQPEIRAVLSSMNIRQAIRSNPKASNHTVSSVIASLNSSDFGYALKKFGS